MSKLKRDEDESSNDDELFEEIETKDDKNIIIELENIQKTYLLGVEGVPALRGVSLKVKKGEFIIIYGKSGGGKTSLLNIIGTIDRPTKGTLTICGRRIGPKTKDTVMAEVRLKKMGFVFQTFNLLSTMSALENVEMPMILRGSMNVGSRRKRAIELLTRVGMADRMGHRPSMLSGGEQQRVTIARAISNKPEILLLDEPTGDLDSYNSDIVMEIFHKLHKDDSMTMLMVTHDSHLKNAADRCVFMQDGKIGTIEIISEEKRREFYQDLSNRLKKGKNKVVQKKKIKKLEFSQKTTELRKPLKNYEYQSEEGKKAGEMLLNKFCQTNDKTVQNYGGGKKLKEEIISIEEASSDGV